MVNIFRPTVDICRLQLKKKLSVAFTAWDWLEPNGIGIQLLGVINRLENEKNLLNKLNILETDSYELILLI